MTSFDVPTSDDPATRKALRRAWFNNKADKLASHIDTCVPGFLAEEATRAKAWRKQYPKLALKTRLKDKFGITVEQYDKMLADQGFMCAICGDPLKEGRSTHVDHCHTTGKIRGVLCRHCNSGLGYFRDDPDKLFAAATYLTPALQV